MDPVVHRTGPKDAPLCLVEVRPAKHMQQTGWSEHSTVILDAVLTEYGLDPASVARVSVTYLQDSVPVVKTRRVLDENLGKHQVVFGMGPHVMKALCKTPKTLDKYAGSLTRYEHLWVLPSYHTNVLNDYETAWKFDLLYDHLRRAVSMVRGELDFPPVGGHKVDWKWYGHNGTRGEDNVWSGYFESTMAEEVGQGFQLNFWISELDALEGTDETIVYAIDTESFTTDHLQPMTMIQVYQPGDHKAYAFNWGVIAQDKELWREFLHHPHARWVLHNTQHDRKMLRSWLDVDLGDRDVDIMAYALGLTEKGKQTGLKYLARQFRNAPFYEEGLDTWLDEKNKNYGHIRPDVLAEYGCLDVFYTYELYNVLPKLVEHEGTAPLVENLLTPLQRTLADISYPGICVDLDHAKRTSDAWEPIITDAIRRVQEYARSVGFPHDSKITSGQRHRQVCDCVPARGRFHLDGARVLSYAKRLREAGFCLDACRKCGNKRYVSWIDATLNVNSPRQMQHLCYDILDMEESPKGPRKCDADFWDVNKDHEFAKMVQEYRQLLFLRRNFLDAFPRFVRSDGRIHPDLMIFGTKTGRLASKEPNLQNIPSRDKTLAPQVKACFVAAPGTVIINADYSSLEMWINGYLTEDPQLLDDLANKDLYKAAAMEIFEKAYEEITSEERTASKPVVLGSGYGIGKKKLSKASGVREFVNGDLNKAQDMIDAFWNRYKVWRDFGEKWRAEVLEKGRLTTEFGRVRRWNIISPDNLWKVRNQAINFKGQSTAADITLTALMQCHWALKERGWGRIILTVHDSLVAEVQKEHVHEAVALMRDIMSDPCLERPFKLGVDFGVGENYAVACDDKVGAYDPDKDYVRAA